MKIKFVLLIAVITVLSGCKVKYDAFQAQYPTQVNWPGKRVPLPVKAAEPTANETLCQDNPTTSNPAPPLEASANTNQVPTTTPRAENTSSIKPMLVAKLQSMKAFQKLSPERQQKVMAKIDKVSAKFEGHPHRVGGMPLAIYLPFYHYA